MSIHDKVTFSIKKKYVNLFFTGLDSDLIKPIGDKIIETKKFGKI